MNDEDNKQGYDKNYTNNGGNENIDNGNDLDHDNDD